MFSKTKNKIKTIFEDIITNIKLYFNEYGHKNAYLMYEEEVQKFQKKIDKLYFEYYNNEEETIYDCYKKYKNLDNHLEELGEINSKINILDLIEEKVTKFTQIFCTSGLFASIILAAFSNIILAIMVFFFIMKKAFDRTDTLVFKEQVKKRIENTEKRIEITFNNCVNSINRKEDKRISRMEEIEEKEEVNIREMAQFCLDYYLGYDEIYPDIPKNVREYLIKMLQDDLKTDVSNLEDLLYMALEKVKIEEFEEEIAKENSRKLEKI